MVTLARMTHFRTGRTYDSVGQDELSGMAEEAIAERIGLCRLEISRRPDDWGWRRHWELELCYGQRELQLRQTRRRAHQEFLESERRWLEEERLRELDLPEYEGNRIPGFIREQFGWN